MTDLQKHALAQGVMAAASAAAFAALSALTKVDWSSMGAFAPLIGVALSSATAVLTEVIAGTK